MNPQEHLIHRQTLEVELSGSEVDGLQWQQKISEFANGVLYKELEHIFNRACPEGQILRFDKLEVTLNCKVDDSNWEFALLTTIAQEIQEKMAVSGTSHANTDESMATSSMGHPHYMNKGVSGIDQLFYFLVYGQLPWYSPASSRQNFEHVVHEAIRSQRCQPAWQDHFLFLLKNKDIRKRLTWQFSDEMLRVMSSFFLRENIFREDDSGIEEQLSTLLPAHRDDFWNNHFERRIESFSSERQANKNVGGDKNSKDAKNDQLGPDGQETKDIPLKQFELSEFWQIQNAGLVLLQPYIPILFEELKITQSGVMMDPQKAVHVLQFVATSQEDMPEHTLTLNKVLCGLRLDEPMKKSVRIRQEEKEEAMNMLKAVIGHWSVLRDTSVENFQGSFLCREGKLSMQKSGDWMLNVETKAWDLLLDQIPWAYSIVKWPWMEQNIWVTWR